VGVQLTDEPGPAGGHVIRDPGAETRKQAVERRLAALEVHIADLEQRLNDRGVFTGDRDA
jgi:hypothetical protein